jgi:radical SAM-linked protein
LAQVPGVYVPQFYDMAADGSVHPNRSEVPKRILRRVATPIPAYSIGLVPYIETVHDRLVIEIRRGCTRGCRFCQPGMLTRPARDVAPEQVIETVEKGMRATGYNEFSLLSLSCSDYLALPAVGMEIKNRLKDENISLSLPSQRVDRFDEDIANIIGGTRKGGLTFAPEAGTQRMRDIVNKGLTNEELLRGVKTAHEQGWDKIKLYFMIGLPGETDVDVLGIVETLRWLRRECGGRRRLDFNITISNFTPKPHTPFQWHSVSTSEFKRKQETLRAEFKYVKGVKVNFTDVRISAMEDFVGRGDRRLAPVIRRAWELGAGMDSWWESLERAYGAWTQAIDESNLTWKYRKVESGEWNVMDGVEGNGLDDPLPWDHLDTGIDKQWLKDDLQRALEAATVPDCSFDGCSHCGVCSTDFGHNVVIQPLEIPVFAGEFVPNQNRAQRLRVRFGKQGDMGLVSHLDLIRLFDRVVRRAQIPITFTGGFHPGPRISPANALALGATSSGEIVDFELTQFMEPSTFQRLLSEHLPENIPVYSVTEVPLSDPSATQAVHQAEYRLTIAIADDSSTPPDWSNWIDAVLATTDIPFEQKTKSGKVKVVNLRDRLFELELLQTESTTVQIRYVGSCQNDGTILRPEHLIFMLESVSGQSLELREIHRDRLILTDLSQLASEQVSA